MPFDSFNYELESLELFKKIGLFFSKRSNNLELNPSDFSIHIGFYAKSRQKEFPTKNKDEFDKAKKLNLLLDFKLLILKQKIKVDLIPGETEYYKVNSRIPSFAINTKNFTLLYLDKLKIRGDFVHDPIVSLERAKLIFAEDFSRLSKEDRRRNFERNLEYIKLPKRYTFPAIFYTDALTKGTYDDDGNYYTKWQNPEKKKNVFSLTDLSDKYLTENFRELKLLKNKYYVLFIIGSSKIVYELEHVATKDVIILKPVSFSGLSQNERPFSILTSESKNQKRAVFFKTVDGVDQYEKTRPIKLPKFKFNIYSDEEVVSPEIKVKEIWNEKGEMKSPSETKHWGAWQWFLEMIHVFFSDKTYELDTSILLNKPLNPASREKLFLNHYKKARDSSTGTLRNEYDKIIKHYELNTNLFVFPQGLPIGKNGKQLFVGMDDSHVYTRYTDIGLTTKMPLDTFLINYSIGKHAESIYKKTKGLIPFIAIVYIISGGAFTIVLFGSAALVIVFKHIVIDFAIGKITKPLIKKAKERFFTQFMLVFYYGFASIFWDQNDRSLRFGLGVLKGMSMDSLKSQFFKYKQAVYEGPRYYRWYKLISRLKAAVRQMENKLAEIKNLVSPKTSKLLLDKLIDAAEHTKNGFLLLVTNLYFLDYKQVQGPLNVFSDLSEAKIPTKEIWEKARKEQLTELLEKHQALIKETIIPKPEDELEIKNLYLDIQKQLHRAHIGFDILNAIKYTGYLIEVSVFALVAGTAYKGIEDLIDNDAKGIKRISSLLFKQFTQFDKYTLEEVEKLGSIVGHLIGAAFLNGSIFKEGTRLGRLSGKKTKEQKKKEKEKGENENFIKRFAKAKVETAMNSFIKDEFGAGYLMHILNFVFSHYIIVFERIKGNLKGGESSILKNITKEINLIILGKEDKDLAGFQTDEEQKFTFDKALLLLSLLDDKLKEYIIEMANDPELPNKLDKTLEKLETSQVPSFEKIIDLQEPTEWIEDSITYVAMCHLHSAIVELREAVRIMYDPVDIKTGLKIVDILHILGISVTEDESRIELLKNANEVFIDDVANKVEE